MRGLALWEAPVAALRLFAWTCGCGARPQPFIHCSWHCSWARAYPVATNEPMMASMAGRYAAALFDLAKEDRHLPQVEADLAAFQSMLDQSADLRRLVRSPVISADDQAKALNAILAKAGLSSLTANFLRLIARNRRLFAVADMIRDFRALVARERGEVKADVASAHPLTPDQLTALKDMLRVQIGKDVQVNTRVDPALLGGLIVKVGSKMIDSSLRTKLNNLKVAMKGLG
ncbi:MAG: F0F1 ATP synthase subunit delta [Hyphomicrobiaceae bacterium]|nr:F0F1 ATP synthase subunit delta [Hyphomicrobiaceae bacterium]